MKERMIPKLGQVGRALVIPLPWRDVRVTVMAQRLATVWRHRGPRPRHIPRVGLVGTGPALAAYRQAPKRESERTKGFKSCMRKGWMQGEEMVCMAHIDMEEKISGVEPVPGLDIPRPKPCSDR